MPRPALTEEQRRETRRQIRQAASDMYAENGLSDISARAIAKRAGVSVGTIYSHFANLTDLALKYCDVESVDTVKEWLRGKN